MLTVGYHTAQLLGIGSIDVVGAPNDEKGQPKRIKLTMDNSKGPLRSWPLCFSQMDLAVGAQDDLTAQTDRPAFLHSMVIGPGYLPGGGGLQPLQSLLQVRNIVINGVRTYVGNGPQGNPTGVPAGSFRPRGFLPSYLGQLTNTGRCVVTLFNGGTANLFGVNAMCFALCAG